MLSRTLKPPIMTLRCLFPQIPLREKEKKNPTLRRRLPDSLLDGVPSLQPGGRIQNPQNSHKAYRCLMATCDEVSMMMALIISSWQKIFSDRLCLLTSRSWPSFTTEVSGLKKRIFSAYSQAWKKRIFSGLKKNILGILSSLKKTNNFFPYKLATCRLF